MNTYTEEELRTRDDRRHQIASLMLGGKWKGGDSRRALAKTWNYRLHDVVQLEREAAGAIRLARSPAWADEVTSALAELDQLIATARRTVKVIAIGGKPFEYKWPNLGAAVSALRTKLQVFGVLAQGGVVHAPPKPTDEYAGLSRQERITLLEQALAEEQAGAKEARH